MINENRDLKKKVIEEARDAFYGTNLYEYSKVQLSYLEVNALTIPFLEIPKYLNLHDEEKLEAQHFRLICAARLKYGI